MQSSLAFLLSMAVSSTNPAHMATVDRLGQVRTSLDSGVTWLVVHRCPLLDLSEAEADPDAGSCAGEPRVAAMDWLGDTLYLACTGGSLWQWQPDLLHARAADSGPVSAIQALAAGPHEHTLIVADTGGLLWRIQPDQEVEAWVHAPEPVLAMDLSDAGVLLMAGPSAVWRLAGEPPSWQLVVPVQACALLAVDTAEPEGVWLAGPGGLSCVSENGLAWHGITPLTGLARVGDHLAVAGGGDVELLPAALACDPAPPDAADAGTAAFVLTSPLRVSAGHAYPPDAAPLEQMRLRAHLACLVPRLSVGATLARAPGEKRSLDVWVWLTWTMKPVEVRP